MSRATEPHAALSAADLTRRPLSRAARSVALLGAVAVAGLLAFAVFGKVATKPPKADDLLGWAQIVGESAAAVAILVFHRRAWAWLIVAIVFGAFVGVTMHGLFGGARTCGCFGKYSPAPEVTMTIDVVVVAASLVLARLTGARAAGLIFAGALLLPAAIGGGLYAMTLPIPTDFKPGSAFEEIIKRRQAEAQKQPAAGADPVDPGASSAPAYDPLSMGAVGALTLVPDVAQELLAGAPEPEWLPTLREAVQPGSSPAWLIFVYDPHCDVCQEFLPAMEGYERDGRETVDPNLRVLTLRKEWLTAFQIEDWAWPASPTVVLIRDGRVIHEWGGRDTPNPWALRDRIVAEGRGVLDELERTHTPLLQQ